MGENSSQPNESAQSLPEAGTQRPQISKDEVLRIARLLNERPPVPPEKPLTVKEALAGEGSQPLEGYGEDVEATQG